MSPMSADTKEWGGGEQQDGGEGRADLRPLVASHTHIARRPGLTASGILVVAL